MARAQIEGAHRGVLLAACLLLGRDAPGAEGTSLTLPPAVTVASPSVEVCPVTVPNPVPPSPRPSYLATAYDFAGSDQGLSVDDPANKVTWLFAGDAKSADSNAWFGVTPTTAGGANMIGYLDGPDYGNPAGLCSHLKLVTVPGMTSKSGGAVWSPDVMLPPPGDPVSNYIFNPTPNKSGATVPTLPPAPESPESTRRRPGPSSTPARSTSSMRGAPESSSTRTRRSASP